ncbi:MAG TPA: hypothetical protein VFW94_18420 [Candidatus Acidoferrales bacterium]|nr:hypothetical protein [Candidatus Acidoferrales bacterium]
MGRAAYNRPDKHQESYGYVPIFKGCEGRSSMPLETWKAVADWSTIVLIALTVVSGSAALMLGRRINDNQQARLQQLDKGLTDAKTELRKQETRAAEAEARVEGLRLNVAEAQKEAAKSNETAEKEKLARLELEARLAPRSLTPVQMNELTKSLSPFGGQTVGIFIFGTSAEVVGITEQISEVLTRAKWTVHFGTAAAGAARGILIGTDSPPSSSTGEAVLALSNALKSVGLSCSVYPITQMPLPGAIMNTNMNMKEPIRVFVGNKP